MRTSPINLEENIYGMKKAVTNVFFCCDLVLDKGG